MPRRLAMNAVATFGVLFVGVALPGSATAQEALPLTGETLISSPGEGGGGAPVTDIQGTCTRTVDLAGDRPGTGTSTFTYTVTGVAAGPYPGTFTESGSFSLGPIDEEHQPGQFRGTLTDFQAEFTIESAIGTVEGTKEIDPGGFNVGACFNYGTAPFNRPNDFAGQTIADTRYEALITLPDGSQYTDTGTSNVQFNYCNNQIGCGTSSSNQFTETYVSESLVPVTPPPPAVPTTPEQCRNGGYANYPHLGFRNQGDCVAFVQTGGRNEPGRNQPN